MVDVTDGADVAVRLVPLKFSLSHFSTPSSKKLRGHPTNLARISSDTLAGTSE